MSLYLNLLWKIKNFALSVLQYKTIGVRALVVKNGKVLLVKHTYMPDWFTIGGGVDKGETPIVAIQRELVEEAGVKCLRKPKLFGVYYNSTLKREDYVVFYIVDKFKLVKSNSPEIEDAQWFDLKNLPKDATKATKNRVAEYLGLKANTEQW